MVIGLGVGGERREARGEGEGVAIQAPRAISGGTIQFFVTSLNFNLYHWFIILKKYPMGNFLKKKNVSSSKFNRPGAPLDEIEIEEEIFLLLFLW